MPARNYDVFLNHRGPDVKKGLVSHLKAALKQVNFTAFVDNMDIQQGEHAWESITSAISASKVLIAVFSPRYAESMWCLDELHLILNCCKGNSDLLFLPIFYNVQPFDLRLEPPSRPSCYRPALKILANRYEASVIDKWTKALDYASMISGFVFPDGFEEGGEAFLVESIVGQVIDVLSKQTLLSGPEHPVGLDEKLLQALEIMEKDQRTRKQLGICGMGGLGKSTLAKLIYNRIHRKFDSACFIQIDSEGCSVKGYRDLQENMLRQLLHWNDISLPDTERGRQLIRDRLSGMKVLIILDNVTEKEQLDQLMPPHDCQLGEDSQIVITTRDKQVIMLAHAHCFLMEGLSKPLAHELFKLHALPMSGREMPCSSFIGSHKKTLEDLEKLAKQVADACHGLPLALELLGSHLQDQDISVWQNTVKALASGDKPIDSQRKVIKILELSYKALGSTNEKMMFLDIACFLKGEHKDKAVRIWGSMYGDESAKLNLINLINKCLVKLSKNGELVMHDLLCAMGRQIVDGDHERYWERSHLWREHEVQSVLQEKKGTSLVRGLKSSAKETWAISSFAGMDALKLLVLSNVTLRGTFKKMPGELRWFQLRYFPLETPFPEIVLRKVVVLDLEGSNFSRFQITDCMLQSLKELNLRNCSNLKELSVRSRERPINLETLILSGCGSLRKVPDFIGQKMSGLRYLDVSSTKITSLPDGITSLQSLTTLLMNDCSQLTSLPGAIGNLSALENIGLDRAPLDMIPFSFSNLISLKSLRLDHSFKLTEVPYVGRLNRLTRLEIISCPLISELPFSVTSLSSLRYFRISDCEKMCELPGDIYYLWQLEELHLNGLVKLYYLPYFMDSLFKLNGLTLRGCCNLLEVKRLPSELTSLDVSGCTSLRCLNMSGCRKLKTLPHGIGSLRSLTTLLMNDCDGLTGFSDVIGQLTTLNEISFDRVPLREFPKSFENLSSLISLRFCRLLNLQELPSTIGNLKGLTSLEIISCPRISEMPQTVANLQNLKRFEVSDCASLSFQLPEIIGRNSNLVEFHVSVPRVSNSDANQENSGCTVRDFRLPTTGYSTFSSLKSITLEGLSMPSLPEDFRKLPNVEELILKGCTDLCEVSCLPSSLVYLNLGGCPNLERILALSSLTRLTRLELCKCTKLVELSGLECLSSCLSLLDITECSSLVHLLISCLEKCTSLKYLYVATSGISLLQDSRRPWIQKMVSLELVSMAGSEVPDYFLRDFKGFHRSWALQNDIEDAWRMDIDVPESRDACRGVLCCFVSKERFDGADSDVRSASTWVKAEVRCNDGHLQFFQTLFYNRIANWEDELHICIFRESHPLVTSLKGGCRLSVIARSIYELWSVEVSVGYVKLMYEENEMEGALSQLTLRQKGKDEPSLLSICSNYLIKNWYRG